MNGYEIEPNSNLRGAKLTDADLTGTTMPDGTNTPKALRPRTCPTTTISADRVLWGWPVAAPLGGKDDLFDFL